MHIMEQSRKKFAGTLHLNTICYVFPKIQVCALRHLCTLKERISSLMKATFMLMRTCWLKIPTTIRLSNHAHMSDLVLHTENSEIRDEKCMRIETHLAQHHNL